VCTPASAAVLDIVAAIVKILGFGVFYANLLTLICFPL